MELTHEPTSHIPVYLDRLAMEDGRNIFVMRDDLLPGGSKQRAVIPLLKELKARGVRKVTYGSPFAGFAQVALAQGCQEVGLDCRIFAEFDPTQSGMHLHPYSKIAESFGADVCMVEDLSEAEDRASLATKKGYEKIPLGFQCEAFQRHFKSAVEEVMREIRQRLGTSPERIWLPVGSSTLARTFLKVVDNKTQLLCVDVHVLPESDSRLTGLKEFPQVTCFSAAQEFKEKCRHNPPLPSNLHYDAKLWKFISAQGKDGDLWWNVAR